MEKIRLGIIGMGNMGSGHLRSILAGECPRVEVTAFADIDPERLSRAKELCPQAAAFGSALDCPAPENVSHPDINGCDAITGVSDINTAQFVRNSGDCIFSSRSGIGQNSTIDIAFYTFLFSSQRR